MVLLLLFHFVNLKTFNDNNNNNNIYSIFKAIPYFNIISFAAVIFTVNDSRFIWFEMCMIMYATMMKTGNIPEKKKK